MSRARRAAALLTIAATGAGGFTAAIAAPRAIAATTNEIHTRTDVPWHAVGQGWTAATVNKNGDHDLVLISPGGQPYRIGTVSATDAVQSISHDGRHVLTTFTPKGRDVQRWRVWDLQTGKVSMTLPQAVSVAGFTRPTGSAVNELLNDNTFQRVTVTGHRELRVARRPGTQIDVPHPGGLLDAASTGRTAVTLYDHVTMRPIRRYTMPKGALGCLPVGWANASTLLEACTMKEVGELNQRQVYAQGIKGGAPHALTAGGWTGDHARPVQGFVDVDSTAVGAVATANNNDITRPTLNVYRMRSGRVASTIKPPLAANVLQDVDRARVVGNTVWYAGRRPGMTVGAVASYNLKTKKVTYLAGPRSLYGGNATSSAVIDSRY